jgi:hypothetical protein
LTGWAAACPVQIAMESKANKATKRLLSMIVSLR